VTLPVSAQAAFAVALVDEWERAGLTDVVVAPGSRSTPITLALAASGLRIHVHIDERSAGFFALGLALASGRPAPVVTTSGTAPAHLLPAVMEAFHANVPMIVCSADRPTELHQVGAAQTVEQADLYGAFARWRFSMDADLPPASWRSIAARTVTEPGPVHLNVGFREPLVATPGDLVPEGRPGGHPWHVARAAHSSSVTVSSPVSGRTGVVVAASALSDPAAVVEAAAVLGWPVLAGPASGCRGSRAGVVVSAFDAILRHPGLRQPEVVLRLGGMPASRVANEWLDALDAADHIVVDANGRWIDPGRSASELIAETPAAVCAAILAGGPVPAPDGWAATWRSYETTAQQTIEAVLDAHPEITEPGVARAVTRALPPEATLLVASSMPIRDVEWYGDPAMTCRVVANRGVNGIDGMVSTALGLAAGSSRPTVAMLGDLAFLHDSGGLVGAARRGIDCTFVVVDNDGGGIFGFLPQAALDPDVFERLWVTPHGTDLRALAAGHGLHVDEVDTAADVAPAVLAAVSAGGVRIVLARTDRQANVALHADLVAAVLAAL
jgi:2-succinyl-5-enolpyruvyl-6-hydroxy-3-cyclohexene-1-carboxylate synthase